MRNLKKGAIIAGIVIVVALIAFVTCTATVETGYTGIVTTGGTALQEPLPADHCHG